MVAGATSDGFDMSECDFHINRNNLDPMLH